MATEHPLRQPMREWLPEIDFAVMHHGFAPHGRDYVLILQVAGTYELTLTHVVDLRYETRVRDEVWPWSWDDNLIDYSTWEAAGEPDGYVWGTNWSLAYPGLTVPDDDPTAARWSERIGKPMYATTLKTDRFSLSIIFHSAVTKKLSNDSSTLQQAFNPLSSFQGFTNPKGDGAGNPDE